MSKNLIYAFVGTKSELYDDLATNAAFDRLLIQTSRVVGKVRKMHKPEIFEQIEAFKSH